MHWIIPAMSPPRTPSPGRPGRWLRSKALLASLLLSAWSAIPPDANAAAAGAVQADWILSRLARPAPMSTGFVELRESPMLKSPMRISGEYRRPDADTLVREVRAPYAEVTTIGQGQVSIARGGRAARRFSLARAPELAGLQNSFGALLSGDRAQLQQHYRMTAAGTRQDWVLTLVPRSAELAAAVRDITLHGRGAELRCIETRSRDADRPQRTLLAGAAKQAADVADPAALAALCTGAGAPVIIEPLGR